MANPNWKSNVVKQAKEVKDLGKSEKNSSKVAVKAGSEYRSALMKKKRYGISNLKKGK